MGWFDESIDNKEESAPAADVSEQEHNKEESAPAADASEQEHKKKQTNVQAAIHNYEQVKKAQKLSYIKRRKARDAENLKRMQEQIKAQKKAPEQQASQPIAPDPAKQLESASKPAP